MSGFNQLGKLLREEVDTSTSQQDRLASRAAVVRAVSSKRGAHTRRAPLLAAAALGVLLVAVLLLLPFRWQPSGEVTFSVPGAARGHLGATYASDASPLPLRFSDGTAVQLHPGAAAYVSHTTAHGATIQVLSGTADVSVVPRANSHWLLVAGPFTVKVTGTAFSMTWDASSRRLDVQMQHGSVLVNGPTLASGAQVSGTERLSVQAPLALHGAATPSALPPTAAPPPPPAAASPEQRDARAVATDAGSRGAERAQAAPAPASSGAAVLEQAPSLEQLIRAGKHDDVLQEAEQRGLDSILTSGSLADLSAVADAARYVGRKELAREALTKLRQRFPSSPRASSAAFVLGRLFEDDGANAVSWFDIYLTESPSGTFAAEAMGRRMLALHRTGMVAEARTAAEMYLARYPSGAYAKHARDLLGQADAAPEQE